MPRIGELASHLRILLSNPLPTLSFLTSLTMCHITNKHPSGWSAASRVLLLRGWGAVLSGCRMCWARNQCMCGFSRGQIMVLGAEIKEWLLTTPNGPLQKASSPASVGFCPIKEYWFPREECVHQEHNNSCSDLEVETAIGLLGHWINGQGKRLSHWLRE